MPPIETIQKELRSAGLDGWLFYDFHHRDPIASRVLGLNGAGMGTRRWFYLIPSRGTPRKLVHRIESGALDSLPGQKLVYASLDELNKNLPRLIGRARKVAMQYSPRNAIPYVSLVDAGTVEMVRAHGCAVVSSADLVQQFEACWSAEQYQSHLEAGRVIDRSRTGSLRACGRAGSRESESDGIRIAAVDSGEIPRAIRSSPTSRPSWPSVRTAATRTTSRRPRSRRRFAKAICSCSTFGESSASRQRLLRHHLGRLSGREGSRQVRAHFRACPRSARRRDCICARRDRPGAAKSKDGRWIASRAK